jgi:glucose-1-phosphatase
MEHMKLKPDNCHNYCHKMSTIDTIIFDLGGVLYDIDVTLTAKAFTHLGISNMEELHQALITENIYERLETGHCSPAEFRDAIRRFTGIILPDEQIDAAWNALLVKFPEQRVKMLLSLRGNYRIMLLSNTNSIHFDYYTTCFGADYGFGFESMFDKAFYSYLLGLRKPNPEIFHKVIALGGINPAYTVFIDDLSENVEAARSAGLQAIHLDGDRDVTTLFQDSRLKQEKML